VNEIGGRAVLPVPTVLVLGANSLSRPILDRLATTSCVVAAAVSTPRITSSWPASVRWETCDVSNPNQVLALARQIRPNAMFSLNDFGLESASAAASALNLLGFSEDQAEICVNKAIQKEFLRENGLPHAPGIEFSDTDSLARAWKDLRASPSFIKPSRAGGGSRGVAAIETLHQGIEHVGAHPEAFRDGGVLEEPLSGVEHTVEVLISGGAWQIVSYCDKENYARSSTVVQYQVFPGPVATQRMSAIRSVVDRLVRAIGMAYGSIHLEVMTSSDTSCTILEFSGRPGGSYNFAPVPQITMSVDYPNFLLRTLLGSRNFSFADPTGVTVAIGHCNVPPPGEALGYTFLGIHLDEEDACIFVSYSQEGRVWNGLINDLVRPGHFLIQHCDTDHALATVHSVLDRYQPKIDHGKRTWKLVPE